MFENTLSPKVREVWQRITPLFNEEDFYLGGGTGLALQTNHRINRVRSLAKETGTRILAWVLMDNHAHLLISPYVEC